MALALTMKLGNDLFAVNSETCPSSPLIVMLLFYCCVMFYTLCVCVSVCYAMGHAA